MPNPEPMLIKAHATDQEREVINDYFARHKKLRKGQQIKEWILAAIEAENAKEAS